MNTLLGVMLSFLRSTFKTRAALALENAALRQQLAVYLRKQKRPQLRAGDRIFWMALSRVWSGWEVALAVVKPATVIAWHRKGFRWYWRAKSRSGKVGRPRIPRRHIDFIRRISQEHPEWGEDRIAEELAAKLGVIHSGSTVRRYMVSRRKGPRGDQTWRTFINNHAKQVWSCDFVTQYTALFTTVYVLVIMEVGSRRVTQVGVTTSPTLEWVKQQVRDATPCDEKPRFLVHDNDGIFGQFTKKVTVDKDGKMRSYRCALDLWLHEVIGIEGLPIPYGAPNANPHVERFVRTLREEALNHFIFLGEKHVRRVVMDYIRYYNGARPSQAIHAIPDPYPELREPPPKDGELVALPVLGGLHHDYRLAA